MPFTEQLIQIIKELPLNSIKFLWSIINPILLENWKIIALSVFVLLNIAMLKFVLTGRWSMLGSLLYNLFFCGVLYLIIRIFGPDIIVEDYFKTISFFVYVLGFFLTRLVLNALQIKNLPKFHY